MMLSAQTLDLFFDQAPLGLAFFRADLTLVRANPTWCRFLRQYLQISDGQMRSGASFEAILATVLVHEQSAWRDWLAQVLRGEAVENTAVTFAHFGQTVHWHISLLPLDINTPPEGFLFSIHDQTPEKQAEQELQAMQNALLTLMSNLPGMAYRGQPNPQRRMELVNATAVELTGYPAQTFLLQGDTPYATLIHPADLPAVLASIDTAVADKTPFEIVYRLCTREGQLKWVLERGAPVLSHENNVLALEGFILDITERVLAQQLLERRVADRTYKLTTMHQITKVAAEHLHLTETLVQIAPLLTSAVNASACAIFLLDETGLTLKLVAAEGLPKSLSRAWPTAVPLQPFYQKLLSAPATCTTHNLQTDADIPTTLQATGWQLLAAIPFLAQQRPCGLLLCLRERDEPFTINDLNLLESVADQLGATAESARLRQENNRLLILEERHRLARELHDAVTHSLYSLTLFAETTKRLAAGGDMPQVIHYSERMKESARQSLREMRLLLHNLRPPSLSSLGLAGAIQQRLEAVENRAGVSYTFVTHGDLENLPRAVEESLWHIAEEALNNVLKHAEATAVIVRLARERNIIQMQIEDNGAGHFAPEDTSAAGQGVRNMQERTALLQGKFTIAPATPHGTIVQVQIDLTAVSHLTPSPLTDRETPL